MNIISRRQNTGDMEVSVILQVSMRQVQRNGGYIGLVVSFYNLTDSYG